MKIAFILSSLKKCGPNVVIKNLIKELQKNCDITIFYLDDIGHDFFTDVDVAKVSYKNIYSSITVFNEYDIVHSNGIRPDLINAFYGLTKRSRSKTISTIHNHVFQDLYYSYGMLKSIIFGFIWCILWLVIGRVVVLSNLANQYYWFIPSSKKYIVKNGVEQKYNNGDSDNSIKYREIYHIPKSAILVGTCANLTKRKGIDIVINEMSNKNDIYFIVAGDGNEKGNLQKLINAKHLEKKVKLIDFVDDTESFMSQIDIFIMPSRSEGFGLTVIEAVGVGTPVITSNIPIFQELFQDMTVQFNLNEPHELEKIIHDTYKEKKSLIHKHKIRMLEKYTSSIMCKKYSKIYEEIIREQQ